MTELFTAAKKLLAEHPKRLDDPKMWLFVTVNTARALIDNTDRSGMAALDDAKNCHTAAELQRWYDSIQGRYGREGFSFRSSPVYFYLSSLVAFFDDMPLGDDEHDMIAQAAAFDEYLLYSINV